VFHVQRDGDWENVNLVDCATVISEWVVDNYLPNLSNQLSYVRIEGKDLSVSAGATMAQAITPAELGGVVAEPMPNEVAYCVSLRTGSAGRSHRGRKYIPGLPRTIVALNNVTQAFSDAVVADFNTLLSNLATNSYALVVLSRVQGGTVLTNAIGYPVTSVIAVDLGVDSQRPRKPGNGT